MAEKEWKQLHFVEIVEGLPPTKIVCACGARWVGENVAAQAEAHIDMQDAIEELEKEIKLERRNVFDRNDHDEESP